MNEDGTSIKVLAGVTKYRAFIVSDLGERMRERGRGRLVARGRGGRGGRCVRCGRRGGRGGCGRCGGRGGGQPLHEGGGGALGTPAAQLADQLAHCPHATVHAPA